VARAAIQRAQRPYPVPDRDTAPFWEAARQGRLVLPRCLDCGRRHFYPRAICPHCMGGSLEWVEASGRGSVHSFTVVHRPPSGFEDDVPYVVALIDLEEGVRMMSRITGCAPAEVRIGLPVEVVFQAGAADAQAGPEEFQLPFFQPTRKEA
jgi:uncharacterized protein